MAFTMQAEFDSIAAISEEELEDADADADVDIFRLKSVDEFLDCE